MEGRGSDVDDDLPPWMASMRGVKSYYYLNSYAEKVYIRLLTFHFSCHFCHKLYTDRFSPEHFHFHFGYTFIHHHIY